MKANHIVSDMEISFSEDATDAFVSLHNSSGIIQEQTS